MHTSMRFGVMNGPKLRDINNKKIWFVKAEPILASKQINMSRENLGKCRQFFTGHGWWKKHLFTAKLSNDSE